MPLVPSVKPLMGTIDGSTKQGVALSIVWTTIHHIIQTQSLSDVQQSPKTAVSRYNATTTVNANPK